MVITAPEFKSPKHIFNSRSPDVRTMVPINGFNQILLILVNIPYLEHKLICTKLGFSPDRRFNPKCRLEKREKRNFEARR